MTEVNQNPCLTRRRSRPVGRPDQPSAHKRVGRWLSAFGAWLLPTRCTLCAVECKGTIALCTPCRNDLEMNRPCCSRCAEPLPRAEPLCGRCLKREPPFEAAFAGFRYAWPLDGLIARFKFAGDLAAGRTLARLLATRIRAESLPLPALLVPVPLHRRRLRQRGYDQALELARDIAHELDLPLAANLLSRTRATAAQTDLDAAQRRRNVRRAFAVNPRSLSRLSDRPPIALLDDVMTTGSTLRECATVLKRAGFTNIQVWAIARAPARSL